MPLHWSIGRFSSSGWWSFAGGGTFSPGSVSADNSNSPGRRESVIIKDPPRGPLRGSPARCKPEVDGSPGRCRRFLTPRKRAHDVPLPLLLLLAAAVPDTAPAVDFQREIQPILARHCTRCHGPAETEAGLNLTRQASVLSELESGGRAIVAGDPEQSALWQRIRAEDASERMPPEGDPLSKEQKEVIRRWILQGASWQEHWAFPPA